MHSGMSPNCCFGWSLSGTVVERAEGRGCHFLIKAWNWHQGLNPMEKGCVDQLGESVPSQSFYIELQSLFFVISRFTRRLKS